MLCCLQLVKWVKSVWSEYSLEENYWAHVEMFPATASQHQSSDIFSNLTIPTTNSQFDYTASRIADAATPAHDLIPPLHARSDSLPIIQTVPVRTESSPFLSSQMVSVDQESAIADTGEHVSYDRNRI